MKQCFMSRGQGRVGESAAPSRISIEALERRVLLSHAPVWVEQGPDAAFTSAAGGSASVVAAQVGAIEVIATHPTNPDVAWIGAVNGGIWRTDNLRDDFTTEWEPLTDDLPSLSIGALAISPLSTFGSDPFRVTLYAGIGAFSAFGRVGGPTIGVLKSDDGGENWSVLGQDVFGGLNIRSVVPTTLTTPQGHVVLAAATNNRDVGGVFRSANGGLTWTQISGLAGSGLPAGAATHLVPDPSDPNRFYAAVAGDFDLNGNGMDDDTTPWTNKGVYRSDDGGLTWTSISSGLHFRGDDMDNDGDLSQDEADEDVRVAKRIELSVYSDPEEVGPNVVYAALIAGSRLSDVFRSTDQGANWREINNFKQPNDSSKGGQAGIHFAFRADIVDANVFWIGGDTRSEAPFVGNVFKVTVNDASPGDDKWESVVLEERDLQAPHADARDFAFDAHGSLIHATDGGLYRYNPPGTPSPAISWAPIMGTRVTEFFSGAYDHRSGLIIGGTQDNGTLLQGSFGGGLLWGDLTGGDGAVVAVDNTTVTGHSLHYAGSQWLGGFRRRVVFPDGSIGAQHGIDLEVRINSGLTIDLRKTDENGRRVFDPTLAFYQDYLLNSVDPTRMLIPTSYLYESSNRGDELRPLSGVVDLNSDGIDNDNDEDTDEGDEFGPGTALSWINLNVDGLDNDGDGNTDEGDEFQLGRAWAAAYGGRMGLTDAADVTWIGTDGGFFTIPNGTDDDGDGLTDEPDEGTATSLLLRTSNATNSLADFQPITTYLGATPRKILMDPDNWQTVYILDFNGQIWRTTDAGATAAGWTAIAGNLNGNVTQLESMALADAGAGTVLWVGGLEGVFAAYDPTDNTTLWTPFGTLPTVFKKALVYDATDDVLVVTTLGRGAWKIQGATGQFAPGTIRGTKYTDGNGDNMRTGETFRPLAGWRFWLDLDRDGKRDALEPSRFSDDTGAFEFANLAPGHYLLGEELQSGMVPTAPEGAFRELEVGGGTTFVEVGNAFPGFIQGVKYEDLDGNGRRGSGEPGLHDWTIYLDLNENNRRDEQIISRLAFVPQSLPNSWSSPTINFRSGMMVSGLSGRVTDVDVHVSIRHASVQELTLRLISPWGTPVTLANAVGGATADYWMTTFDDAATVPISSGTGPFTGSFQPQGDLSRLNGETPNGRWELQVVDNTGATTGVLVDWSLSLKVGEPRAITDAMGFYRLNTLPGTHVVAEQLQAGWLQMTPRRTHREFVPGAFASSTQVADFGNVRPGEVTGLKFLDQDRDGVQGAEEPGLSGWTVYLDMDDDGEIDEEAVSLSDDELPREIPDLETIFSDIVTGGLTGRVVDVNVTVDVSHAILSHLDLFLISPMGTRIELFADLGGTGSDLAGTTFDDEADLSITSFSAIPPYRGSFRPEQPLRVLDGQIPNGTWTLEVGDDSFGTTGTLNSWTLELTVGDPRTVSQRGGSWSFTGLPPGDYDVREVMIDPETGSSCVVQTTPGESGAHSVTLQSGASIGELKFGNAFTCLVGLWDPDDLAVLLVGTDDIDRVIVSTVENRFTITSDQVPVLIYDPATGKPFVGEPPRLFSAFLAGGDDELLLNLRSGYAEENFVFGQSGSDFLTVFTPLVGGPFVDQLSSIDEAPPLVDFDSGPGDADSLSVFTTDRPELVQFLSSADERQQPRWADLLVTDLQSQTPLLVMTSITVTRFALNTLGGNDLLGFDLSATTALSPLELQISSGDGHDQVGLVADEAAFDSLKLEIDTGAGDDLLLARFYNQQRPFWLNGALQIRTGEGDDLAQILIGSTANPLPNQAINLHINADGEGGNDELALLLSLPAVQGQLGAQLRGGSGDDRLALVGQNLSLRRNFLLHGGTGQDACFASDDVRVLACESHGALESLTSFGDVLQRLDSSLKELFA